MVIVGVLLLLLRWAEFGPFARMPWWVVAVPFGAAVLWWEYADKSGWTQRRVMEKLERRKEDRRQAAMDSLGLNKRREKQVTRARVDAARRASADPTQADDPAPPPPRRDPRL
jgi:small Trp-rich protein